MDAQAIDQGCDQGLYPAATAGYAGPATVISRDGELDVTVDLRPSADSAGAPGWVGYVDNSVQSEPGALACVGASAGQYGLTLRLPDGREGHFIPSTEIGWAASGFGVSGFLRW
jgi:hypothetical protein